MRPLIAVATALFAVGCGAHYNFVRKADPNPFAGKTKFHIVAPDFGKATVEGATLADWQGKDSQAKDWSDNSAAAAQAFLDEVNQKKGDLAITTTGSPAEDEVLVVPAVESFVPGFYIGISARPTTVVLHGTLFQGTEPADEVVFQNDVKANLYNPTFTSRLAADMRTLADQVVEYLRWRSAK